jgi:hypothetical protein
MTWAKQHCSTASTTINLKVLLCHVIIGGEERQLPAFDAPNGANHKESNVFVKAKAHSEQTSPPCLREEKTMCAVVHLLGRSSTRVPVPHCQLLKPLS